MADKILIKKYANRRLYDTEKSAYITLDNISHMIKQGKHVEIIDAKTKEDVTAFVLTQIILEEAKNNKNVLPVPLLLLLIQYGENVLSEFFEKHLYQTIQNYLSYKTFADDQFKKWLDMGMDASNLVKGSMTEFAPFKPFFDFSPYSENRKGKPASSDKAKK
ncbi:MAG: polyhydroxyalkanoate synthesis regulator DNA-binding domain-containing protein [Deltaproteobacteria bacterium]|nr:polyhydroxyalkanoate synthesis regulator DNA-binding domain-containing protein [Deltaproteobacteria bacterium]